AQTGPTVDLATDNATVTLGGTDNTVINITLSQAAADFEVGDLSVSPEFVGTFSNFSGGGTSYSVTFTGSVATTVTLSIAAGAFTDAATEMVNNQASNMLPITIAPAATPTMPILTVQVGGNGSGRVAVYQVIHPSGGGDRIVVRQGDVITSRGTTVFDLGTQTTVFFAAVGHPDSGSTQSRNCAVVGTTREFAPTFYTAAVAGFPEITADLRVAFADLEADLGCEEGFFASQRAGNLTADRTISFTFTDPTAPALPTVTIRADAAGVSEGADATFTLTANPRPSGSSNLVVNVDVTDGDGDFIRGTPPTTATINLGSDTGILTVPTDDDNNDEPNGLITVTIASGSAYSLGATTTASVEIDDNDEPAPDFPTITLGWDSKASPGTTSCAASAQANRQGICEGDTIVYTLTAAPAPTVSIDVTMGRLAAGKNPGNPYGLTNPNNYVSDANDDGPVTITFAPGQSTATHEIPTNNGYGSENLGAYYAEITCPTGGNACLTDGSTLTYSFVAATRGAGATPVNPLTTNCGSRVAGGDGDESSECLVDIHPVPAPTLSVTADATTVIPNGTVTFTITSSTGAPNYYVSQALAALPITLGATQAGTPLTNLPAVTLGIGETTATATIATGAATGDLVLTLSAATGYSVSTTNASATVAVEEDTTAPTVNLTATDTTIDTGAATTINIAINEPTTDFELADITVAPAGAGTLSGLASVTGTTNYTVTFTAGSNATTASLTVAAGAFNDAAGNDNTASNTLQITVQEPMVALPDIPTGTPGTPAVVLAALPSVTLGGRDSTIIHIALSEAVTGFELGDISVSPAATGSLSNLSGGGQRYTATFTGIVATTVTLSIAADRFMDATGTNGNEASNMLAITVEPAAVPTAPRLTVRVGGNGSGKVAVYEITDPNGARALVRQGELITATTVYDFGTQAGFYFVAAAHPDSGSTLTRNCKVVGNTFDTDNLATAVGSTVIAADLGIATADFVAGNGCSAGFNIVRRNQVTEDRTILFTFTNPNAPPIPAVNISADSGGVPEGTDATFTITADRGSGDRPALVVNVDVTDSGSFISGTPPDSVTINEGSNEAILTITTEDDTEDEPNGNITATIASGDRYTLGTATTASIEVDDNDGPNITINYDARVNAGQMCAASSETSKAGVCEGDTIIFTLTADPAPANDLPIRLGRLEAGIPGALNYGLTSPGDYVPEANDRGNRTVTILANTSSITHEIDTTNNYGSDSLGGYYLEVVCVNQPDNDGVAGNNSFECLTDDTIPTDYTFTATSRGNQSAGALTPANSHCDGGAGNDGDESSECLVHIHPVTAPVIAVAAVSTGAVAEGGDAEFSITADKVPNHYNADRTALANLPISITLVEAGDVTDAASPMLVNIPAAGSTNTFSISLTDDSTGWDGGSPSISASVAASGDMPVRYTPHGTSNSASVPVTDDETITVVMGANPDGVAEGDPLTFTVEASGATLEADLVLSYTTGGTATAGTDYTAPSGTVTLTAGTSTADIAVVTLADNETDAGETVIITLTDPGLTGLTLGGNTAATGTIANDAPFDNPTLSVTGDGAVFEGLDAVFTITANGPPANELTVTVTVANVAGKGDFIGANAPTSVTLPNTAATWTVAVPTKDSTGGDGSVVADGAITLTLAAATSSSGYMVSTAEGANSGTVTVQDVPVITIDWDSKARPGTKTCDAAKNGTDFSGVCEGDAIIYTITSTPPPAVDMSVEIERCSAGGCDALGLTSPYSYGPADQDRIELEIPASTASITYERVMSNQYGAQNDGGYLVEIACRDGSSGTSADGTCPAYQDGRLSAITPAYRFTDTAESPAVGPDDNDDSEAFADVRSVAAPALTVAADNASVEQGTDAAFTITGTSVPNHYNADRTALAGLPISITVDDSGASLAGTAPTMATVAVGATTVGVTISTQAGDAGDGNITLTLAAATGYSVGTPSAATVSVTEPVTSPIPTIALAAASNSGATDDLITNEGSPTFDLGNLVTGATILVTAERADASAYRLTLVATGATGSVTFMDSHTACEFRFQTFGFAAATVCELGDVNATDGTTVWTITATQQSPGEIVSTVANLGTVTIDLGAPTVTLTGDTAQLVDGETTNITATVSEASTLAADDFTVTGGALSSFTQVTDSDTEYTAVFTAANATASPITASISVGASTFTDTAGNDNDAASNALQITVAALDQTAAPTIALADASNG
ncbi:MAG: Ig-like domain-containing protein, partial [Pseudohongiellaceae bacterium]